MSLKIEMKGGATLKSVDKFNDELLKKAAKKLRKEAMSMRPIYLEPLCFDAAFKDGYNNPAFKPVKVKPVNWFAKVFWRFIKVETTPKAIPVRTEK